MRMIKVRRGCGVTDPVVLPLAGAFRPGFMIGLGIFLAGCLLLLLPQSVRAESGIQTPADGAVLSGVVAVRGTAEHPTFRKWQADLVLDGDESHATFLAMGDEPVRNDLLFTWDTTLYPDGDHQLRLRVVHSNLNYAEYFVPVTLRNGGAQAAGQPTEQPAADAAGDEGEEPSPAEPQERPAPEPRADAPDADRWIEVDISDQRLIGWENGVVRFDYQVSTGKPGFYTLPGTFSVYRKYEETRMRGNFGGESYDTPDVPWTMYYYGGFAIHGAYWHDDFGTPVSHGCVNLPVEQAKTLYEWADVGIPVVVHE